MSKAYQGMIGVVCAVAALCGGCVSAAEDVTGTYEGDANFILMLGGGNNSSLYRKTLPVVPKEGEDQIVVIGWDGFCRAEAVVEELELEVSSSTCSFPFQGGTMRLTYDGSGDVSDSGALDLALSGSATYIDANGGTVDGTFSFTFSGKRQE
jgi:hypothetical protein